MISQLNAMYVPEEDRVIFRFNTNDNSEFRMWFTRALVHGLIQECSKVALKSELIVNKNINAQAISEFKQDIVQANTQFTDFNPSSNFPLGENPVLVKRVNLGLEQKLIVLAFDLTIGQTITLRLNDDLFAKFRLLMDTIEKRASWSATDGSTVVASEKDESPNRLNINPATKLLH
jgi:hypothetical protein